MGVNFTTTPITAKCKTGLQWLELPVIVPVPNTKYSMKYSCLCFGLLVLANPCLRGESGDSGVPWPATDGLGRSLPMYEEAGTPRKDRFVAVFYFLWLGQQGDAGPFDNTKILAADPAALTKPDSPLWGPLNASHHWGEPLFGYYVADDDAVLAKHAQMLDDAGVDVVIFDATNQLTYPRSWQALCRVWSGIRRSGGHTPQIAFLCPFWDPKKVLTELYHDLYGPGLYSDLWFCWEGKPLILADPALLQQIVRVEEHDQPVELRTGHTLGQVFRADKPFTSVGGCFPTWRSANAGLTLSLRRTAPGSRVLLARRFDKVADNAWLTLPVPNPLPPGDYVLEISAPAGQIGWWSHSTNTSALLGSAMADGTPVRGIRNLQLASVADRDAPCRGFFTYRKPQPDYFAGPQGPNEWSWLEVYPQHAFTNAAGAVEEVAVGVCQNAVDGKLSAMSNPRSHGRSFHDGSQPGPEQQDFTGRNFAEQWNRAIALKPQLIFVTGWNEWIAGRFPQPSGFYGDGPVTFVDEFNREFSRDCEPMLGGHGDAFYWQLVANIRRFKGVPAISPVRSKPIVIDGKFDDWAKVGPEFRDDLGDPVRRDHPGWAKGSHYTNRTGRNDIVAAKVSADERNIYFYVRTQAPLTSPTDPNWMLLFIDSDRNARTGWLGYDFAVRKYNPQSNIATVERQTGDGYQWSSPVEVDYRLAGNELELAVPRAALGIAPETPALDFKWADNIRQTGDWSDFTLNGDAAPNDRYNFRAIFSRPPGK